MEATGAVLRRAPAILGVGIRRGDTGDPFFSGVRRSFRISARPRGLSGGCGGGFSDEGHVKYYVSPATCGARKEEKRRAKLVKGLVRDLSAFYSMGFGVEAGDGLAGEVKGKMISEAAELLLAQLKQLRAQEKEIKRKRKEEKAAKKAAKVKDCIDENTSSSSSESSDSECESAVKMSSLRTATISELKEPTIPTVAPNCNSLPLPLELSKTGEEGIEENSRTLKLELECSNTSATTSSCGCCSNNIPLVDRPMDKIEVCMGGKCKKSGALQLLEEFQRKIGIEGAVVGCKCMGKCRDGPNVRVPSHRTEDDNAKNVKNPLCIGVGLDDVGTIVASYFGERGIGLVTP